MGKLSSDKLIEVYFEAKYNNLDEEFIELVAEEIERRGIELNQIYAEI